MRRSFEHYNDAVNRKVRQWIKILRIQNTRPVLTVVAECSDEEAPQAELDAIAMVRATRGEQCLNIFPFSNLS